MSQLICSQQDKYLDRIQREAVDVYSSEFVDHICSLALGKNYLLSELKDENIIHYKIKMTFKHEFSSLRTH